MIFYLAAVRQTLSCFLPLARLTVRQSHTHSHNPLRFRRKRRLDSSAESTHSKEDGLHLARILWDAHPLQATLASAVGAAWTQTIEQWSQRDTPDRHDDAVDSIHLHARQVFHRHLAVVLNVNTGDLWRAGDVLRNERDVVCTNQPIFSFNCVTSGTVSTDDILLHLKLYQRAPGAFRLPSTMSDGANQRAVLADTLFPKSYFWHEGYQMLLKFDPSALHLLTLRFGWLERDDWRVLTARDRGEPDSGALAVLPEHTVRSKTVALKLKK